MAHAPHFLRVVQALAFVSGFGPVVVAVATSVACSNAAPSPPVCTGPCPPGEGEYGDAAPADEDAGVDAPADAVTPAYDGTVVGIGPAPEGNTEVK